MKNNFNLKNKFALGSASFVQNYSLYKKKISLNEVKKILSEMIKNNIFMVDTAKRYGDLYNIFSEKKFKKIDFIFKISKFNTFDDIQQNVCSFRNEPVDLGCILNCKDLSKQNPTETHSDDQCQSN